MPKKAFILLSSLIAIVSLWNCKGAAETRDSNITTGAANFANNNETQDVVVFPQLGHNYHVTSVAYSPDGVFALSGSIDSTLKLWDVATGREIRTFSGHSDTVNSVAFSPDGKQVLSGSGDSTIKLWDASTGREIRTFLGHRADVSYVAFSPDGKQALSGSGDSTIKLWDVATGHEIRTFSGHSDSVSSVAYSPDGRFALSCSDDSTLRLWDISTGLEVRIFSEQDDWFHSVTYSPDGRYALSGSDYGTLKLWEISTGREVRTFSEHNGNVLSVSYSPDGRFALSGSSDSTLKLWDISTGREIRAFEGHSVWVNSVAFSPDGKQILSGLDDNILKLWDVATGREIRTFSGHSTIYSPDGRYALSGSDNGMLKLLDISTGHEVRTFSGHSGGVRSVAFSPDGRQVLSGSEDHTLKLWDAATGRETRSFSGHSEAVDSVAFSPDGRQVLSGSWDKTIKLWDASTGREIRTFSGHSYVVESVAFSPDGRQVLSGSADSIKLWEISTGREIRTFSGHSNSISSVVYSPNGRYVLSGSTDSTLKLWDASTGREIRTFSGHSGLVISVAFSPDGKLALSGSTDGTTRLWDASTGNEIAQFISFTDGEWIAITPEGYYNSSPNGDKYLNVRVGNNVFGIDQYRETFYNPELVALALSGDRNAYLAVARQTIQNTAAPPLVSVTGPASVTAGSTNISVTVDSGNQSIEYLTVQVNGRVVARDLGVTPAGSKGLTSMSRLVVLADGNVNRRRASFSLEIPLEPGDNIIEVIAFNGHTEGRGSVEVSYRTTQTNLPNLYILSVGVNNYTDNSIRNLRFAANDARSITAAFKTQEGRRYGSVRSLVIADGADMEPTRDNISNGMDFLRGAGQTDVMVLFLSGHGGSDDRGNFYFMPGNMAFNQNGTPQRARIIPNSDLQDVLHFPGQKLVFIDSCYSGSISGSQAGSVNNDLLINSLKDDSPVIFTSSSGTQQSWEHEPAGLGLFTYVLIQGFSGAADADRDGRITIEELGEYVKKTVPSIRNAQQPYLWAPPGYRNFVVAETRR